MERAPESTGIRRVTGSTRSSPKIPQLGRRSHTGFAEQPTCPAYEGQTQFVSTTILREEVVA